jgi:glycosyltransferase involved in cell wall biosynthesis
VKILIVSGIWPPDVGGPASHGPELGRFLLKQGHTVTAVASTPDGQAQSFGFPVRGVARGRSRAVRMVDGLVAGVRAARAAEVVYATGGMYARAALTARLTSLPLVLKLVNDPAYERARRLGLFDGSLEEFQSVAGGTRVRALKAARLRTLRQATRIVTPGHYLERLAVDWGIPRERFAVVPNPAARVDQSVERDELRRRCGIDGFTYVFAGRFVKQKNVPLAVRALARAPGARLVLIGEGEERAAIDQAIHSSGVDDRVSVRPALPREEAIQWVRAADAAILPSDWEGFPHAAVEALSVGTPVIATATGAVPEIVNPGANGLLVAPGDEAGLGAAMASLGSDAGLLGRLRAGAAETGDRYAPERTFEAIEEQLRQALMSTSSA